MADYWCGGSYEENWTVSPVDKGVTLTKILNKPILEFSASASLEVFTLTVTGTYTSESNETETYSNSISQTYSVKSLFTTEFLSFEATEAYTSENYEFKVASPAEGEVAT